ncbi:rhodanese-like domain-containing protein [Nakamurella sp.]|uniref:rhodanese-like domain-containing protein n=1 Tax=Nakamurella sp. TaxID=1869182 RepID=UPI0037833CBF
MIRTRTAAAAAVAALLLGGCSSAAPSVGLPTHDHPTSAGSPPAMTDDAEPAGQVRLLDPADFEAQSGGRLLINVHIPDEGSLTGTALDLPYNEVSARAAELPADKAAPLAIYCMSGNMSAIAGRELLALGYTDVIELDGGMQAWQASGRTLLPAAS